MSDFVGRIEDAMLATSIFAPCFSEFGRRIAAASFRLAVVESVVVEASNIDLDQQNSTGALIPKEL